MNIYNNIEEVKLAGDIKPNSIIKGDCLEVMKYISDKSVDCIICDLPYGTTACSWDTIIPFQPLWEQYKRIIKDNGAVLLFSSQPFTTDLIISARDWFKYEIIWDKMHGTDFQLANIKPMKAHENILVFAPNKTTYNKQMIKRDKAIDTTGWRQDKRNKDHNNFHSSENIVKVYEDKTQPPFYNTQWLMGSVIIQKEYTQHKNLLLS